MSTAPEKVREHHTSFNGPVISAQNAELLSNSILMGAQEDPLLSQRSSQPVKAAMVVNGQITSIAKRRATKRKFPQYLLIE